MIKHLVKPQKIILFIHQGTIEHNDSIFNQTPSKLNKQNLTIMIPTCIFLNSASAEGISANFTSLNLIYLKPLSIRKAFTIKRLFLTSWLGLISTINYRDPILTWILLIKEALLAEMVINYKDLILKIYCMAMDLLLI